MAALDSALARSSSSSSRLEDPGAPLETGSPPGSPPVEDGGVSWGGRFINSGDRPSRFKFLKKILTFKYILLQTELKWKDVQVNGLAENGLTYR